MKLNSKVFFPVVFIIAIQFVTVTPAQDTTWWKATGYDDLQAMLGANTPDGAGIAVSQVEASTPSNAYLPDPNNPEFLTPDKNFVNVSGLNNLVSGHADGVTLRMVGNETSIANGVVDVYVYEVENWLNFGIGFAGGANPQPHPYAVQNHSWVAGGIQNSIALNILARGDYVANENNMNMICGVGNSQGNASPQLMVHGYNSISVGRSDGIHSTGPTTFLGFGRRKPELVAIAGSTSVATARITSIAAAVRDMAQGTNAENNEVTKAIILAGATKSEFTDWDQADNRPIDNVYGVGEANIYNSYMIFQGGETDGANGSVTEIAGSEGWDFESIEAFGSRSYIIDVTEPADHLSLILTWNRQIEDANANPNLFLPSPILPDLDVLVTGNGVSVFSESNNHNIEHVYLKDVEPGQYIVVVFSDRDAEYALAWRTAEIDEEPITSVDVISGSDKGGTIADLAADDGDYFVMRPGLQAGDGFTVSLEFEAMTSINMPNGIELTLDAKVNTPNIEVEFEFYNFDQQEFVSMQTIEATTTQTAHIGEVFGELNDYIDPAGGGVRARATWRATGVRALYPWSVMIDKASFQISQ